MVVAAGAVVCTDSAECLPDKRVALDRVGATRASAEEDLPDVRLLRAEPGHRRGPIVGLVAAGGGIVADPIGEAVLRGPDAAGPGRALAGVGRGAGGLLLLLLLLLVVLVVVSGSGRRGRLRGRGLLLELPGVEHEHRAGNECRAGREQERLRQRERGRETEGLSRLLPRTEGRRELRADAGRRRRVVLGDFPEGLAIVPDRNVPELRGEPSRELVLEDREEGLDRMREEARAGLDVLRPAHPGVGGRGADADHPRVDPERGANILPRDAAEVRELEVGQREPEGLDVADAAHKLRDAAPASVDLSLEVGLLHRAGVLRRRLVGHQDDERRRAIVPDDLPNVGGGLVVGRHRGQRRRRAREAEHVRPARRGEVEVAKVEYVLRRRDADDAVVVGPIVPHGVAVAVDVHKLEAFRVDAAEREPARFGAVNPPEGVPVGYEVKRELPAERPRGRARGRRREEHRERVRRRKGLAPALAIGGTDRDEGDGRGEVRNHARASVHDGMLFPSADPDLDARASDLVWRGGAYKLRGATATGERRRNARARGRRGEEAIEQRSESAHGWRGWGRAGRVGLWKGTRER